MTELDVECILQRAREKYPDARPRIISDNGPQFVAGEFKEFIRHAGMTHVRTAPYYPQSNGKLERWHYSVLEQARSQRAKRRTQLRGQPSQPATPSGELASPLLMNFLGGFALNQNRLGRTRQTICSATAQQTVMSSVLTARRLRRADAKRIGPARYVSGSERAR